MDFSHPFYTTGFGIAVPYQQQGWLGVLERFFSPAFPKVMRTLCLVLLVFGLLSRLFERRRNPEQFGGPALKESRRRFLVGGGDHDHRRLRRQGTGDPGWENLCLYLAR